MAMVEDGKMPGEEVGILGEKSRATAPADPARGPGHLAVTLAGRMPLSVAVQIMRRWRLVANSSGLMPLIAESSKLRRQSWRENPPQPNSS